MSLVRIRSNGSWMRNVAIGSCLAVGLSAFAGGTAGATVTPATGTVNCGVAAGSTASLTPALPMSGQPATTGWTMARIHQVKLDTCDSSGVTGGRSVITGGVLQINARLNPGASCASLVASLGSVNKATLMVKLQNTTVTPVLDPITGLPVIDPTTGLPETTTQTSTSASVHVKNPTATPSGSGVLISGTAQQSAAGNKPFGGETVAVQLNAAGDCSTAPLATIDLTGSTVSIHP
jgi:hypothetical protein